MNYLRGIKPKLEFLNQGDIEYIIDEAYNILSNVGINVENEDVISLLQDNGATIKDGRVYIDNLLINSSLENAQSNIRLWSRDQDYSLEISDDNVHFAPGSAGTAFLDYDSNQLRMPTVQDFIEFTKVVDSFENVDFQSTSFVPQDIHPGIHDSYRLYIALQYSNKPIVTGAFANSGARDKNGFELMVDMLTAIRGSPEELAKRPLAIFDCCPSSPLVWSPETSQNLMDCAKLGIPAELISMPQPGVQAPPTFEGSIIQHTAETLSGVVISQCANPGAPVIYGGSPGTADMKGLQFLLGATGTHMMTSAYVQIGKSLGLPTHGYMGTSDTQSVDYQSGVESANGFLVAALSGMNVISGVGMLYNEQAISTVKAVIDNDACGMAKKISEGIRSYDYDYVDMINTIVKEKTAMLLPETARILREDWDDYVPTVFSRERSLTNSHLTAETMARSRIERITSDYDLDGRNSLSARDTLNYALKDCYSEDLLM